MKQYLIIYIIFASLLSFSLCSTTVKTLVKGSNAEFTLTDDAIIFDVSSFSHNDKIIFEARSSVNILNFVIFKFFDDLENFDINSITNYFEIDSYRTKNENDYKYNYYLIEKNDTYLAGSNGNYLALVFASYSETYIHFKLINETVKTNTNKNSNILKKHSKITVSGTDGVVIMDTSDFQINDKIYLKITATYFEDSSIYYGFIDNLDNYELEDYDSLAPSKTQTTYYNDDVEQTKYYTIKKDSSHLPNNMKGNYLIIYFYCIGKVTVENTKSNEGKLSTGAIVGIIIAIVVVIVIIIIYCICKRRKLAKQAALAYEREVVVDNNQNYYQNVIYAKNQNYINNPNNYYQNVNYTQNQNYNNNLNINYNNNQNINNNSNQNMNYNNNYNQNYNSEANQINVQYYNNDQQQNNAPPAVEYVSKP